MNLVDFIFHGIECNSTIKEWYYSEDDKYRYTHSVKNFITACHSILTNPSQLQRALQDHRFKRAYDAYIELGETNYRKFAMIMYKLS
jgi:hypothetical protein